MNVFRITRNKHLKDDLKGIGASIAPGRWNQKDVFCIYTAESRALALIEHMANITKQSYIDSSYTLRTFFIPDACVLKIDKNKYPLDWREKPPPISTQEFGTQLLQSKQKLAYILASVIIAKEFNIIIDPLHNDFNKLEIVDEELLYFDLRLKH